MFFLPLPEGIGGISKVVSFVANCAVENYEVIVIGPIEKKSNLSIDGRIRWIDYKLDNKNRNPLIAKIYSALKYRKIIRHEGPDLLVIFGADIVRKVIAADIGIKNKIIASERGNPGRYDSSYKKKVDQAYKRCDYTVFLTEEARRYFPTIRNYKIIPNPAIQRKNMVSPHVGGRKKKILLCGSLTEDKNFDLAIDAFHEICNEIQGYEMLIYGGGPLKGQLEKKIADYEMKDCVKIMDPTPDVFSLNKDCRMFILSSKEEGMPNVLLEALSLGIPCISTDCPAGGARAVMGGGKRGILVENDNIPQMSEAILKLATDENLCKIYSENALTVLDEFASEKIADKWNDLFSEVLG